MGTPEKRAKIRPAPFAYGKLCYIYIFVDFQGDSESRWNTQDRNTVLNNAYDGTQVIKNRAPAAANVINDGGYFTVSGSNPGDCEGTWSSSGWMEEAALNLGYSPTGNERSTEVLARAMKSAYNADSVILMFFVHEVDRSYAVGTDQGYADKCVVYFWRSQNWIIMNVAEANVYAHEALHLYGALDEYPEANTYMWYSDLAVSPMHGWYQNTNHHNNPAHQHSLMCAEGLYGVSNPVVSQSTKNFIGWGDYHNDGILDLLRTSW